MSTVIIPGSKSITARVLLLSAASAGSTTIRGALRSDDTDAFIQGLTGLGYRLEHSGPDLAVTGSAGPPKSDREIRTYCRDGATTARFLPALAATGSGRFAFDASEQMRARPMEPLTRALMTLGAQVEFSGAAHHHPLTITGTGLPGGEIQLDAGESSQFASALLLVAPLTRDGLRVEFTDMVSQPYIDMTVSLLRTFGASVEATDRGYDIAPGGLRSPGSIVIEPDASSSSYFFAAAAITGSAVTVPGLSRDALQGDLRFVDVLRAMGADVSFDDGAATVRGTGFLRGGTFNMRDISDTMPTLAAIAPFAQGPVTIVDVYNTRLKECDRLDACAEALRSMDITVRTGRDWIQIEPGTPRATQIRTRRDHRIAMSFSVAGLRTPGLTLDDPECVKKTFPTFHTKLDDFRAGLQAGG